MKLSARFYFLILLLAFLTVSSLVAIRYSSNRLINAEQLLYITKEQKLLCRLLSSSTENYIFNEDEAVSDKLKGFMLSFQQNMVEIKKRDQSIALPLENIKEIENNWSYTLKHVLSIVGQSRYSKFQELKEVQLLTERLVNNFALQQGFLETELAKTKAYTHKLYVFFVILAIADLIACLTLVYFKLHRPLENIKLTAEKLAAGNLSEKSKIKGKGEWADIADSLNQVIDRQQQITTLSKKLGEGNFNFDYALSSKQDTIGQALIDMKEKIHLFFEEDRKRNWINTGLANFSDLFQKWNDNLDTLTEKIIIQLADYLKANQGALFVAEKDKEGEIYLKLSSVYAWNKKKFLKKKIKVGEGLLGQVALEGETKYMTEIPNDFVSITSGMGGANPKSILMVPLTFNNEVQGIIELAFFQELQKYEIEFVEKLSENVASSIHTILSNSQTRKLLEESMELTKAMGMQEEQMRQNMEELQATQEEIHRKETELSGLFASINNTLGTVEYNMEGSILKVNSNMLEALGYTELEMKGRSDNQFVAAGKDERFWRDLSIGKSKSGDFKWIAKDGKKIWFNSTYTPIKDKKGKPVKILQLSQNVTEKKKAEIEAYQLSLVADNTDNSVIITDKNGKIEYVNKGFERLTGYTLEEIKGRKPGSFLQGADTDKKTVEKIRKSIRRIEPSYNELLNYNKNGDSYWVSIAINPVFNSLGHIDKFISIQANITDTKRQALDQTHKMAAIGKSNAIVEFDLKGNILTANERYLEIIKYNLEEVEGKPHSMLVNQEKTDEKAYQTFWKELIEKGYSQGDFKRKTKTGEIVWFRGSFNVINDISDKPFKVVKIAQDVTHEKELELEAKAQAEKLTEYTKELESFQETLSKKLQEARAEMKMQMDEIENERIKNSSILEGCLDAVVTFNQIGFIEFFNKSAENLWGKERIEVIGSTIDQILPVKVEREGKEVLCVDTPSGERIPMDTKVPIDFKVGRKKTQVLMSITRIKIGKYAFFALFIHS